MMRPFLYCFEGLAKKDFFVTLNFFGLEIFVKPGISMSESESESRFGAAKNDFLTAAGRGLNGLGDFAFPGDGEAKKDFLPAAFDIFLAKLVGRGTSSSLLSRLMSPNFLGLGGGGGLAARTAATAFCTAGLC